MDEENRCLRCGAPYEADATVCLSCGAPIGETKSPTQPVRAIHVPKPAAAEEVEPAPSTPASSAADSMPWSAAMASVRSADAGGETRTRGRLQWLFVLLICVVVLAAAGGAAYVLRALTAGPPVARSTVYHDPQHRFSFQRPALWLVTASPDGGVTVSDTAGSSTVKIGAASSAGPTSAKNYADQRAAELGGLGADSPRSIAGEQWEQRSGQATGSDGAVRQYVLLATVHNGQLYSIEIASPIASFDGNNTLVFQPLLASFTFG